MYCNHLTPIFTSPFFPYTGQYGDGTNTSSAWQAEQELQAEKLIDRVTEISGDRPAVILGDLNAGHAYPDQDIVAEGEPTLDLLEAAYDPAYTADYAPLSAPSAAPTPSPTPAPTPLRPRAGSITSCSATCRPTRCSPPSECTTKTSCRSATRWCRYPITSACAPSSRCPQVSRGQ